MSNSNDEILNAGRRGDLKAISLVIYKTFEKNNIWSAILVEDGVLNIHLEAKSNVNKDKIINWLKNFLEKLEVNQIKECHVDFSGSGVESINWTESFILSSDLSKVNVNTKKPQKGIELEVPIHTRKIATDANQKRNNADQKHSKKKSITKSASSKSKVTAILSRVVLVSVVGAVFFMGSRFISQKERENPVLNQYLEDLKPYKKAVIGVRKNYCIPEYSVSQIIQDPSVCPDFEEGLREFCDTYSKDEACRTRALEVFCRRNPSDELCI